MTNRITTNKQNAINQWMKFTGRKGDYVYKFQNGAWRCCSPDSEVGKRLAETGEIYEGVKAAEWDIIR